jgi:UDP-glucose:(heptosyl)LPS alpha-1,3-glucosyltransferase
VDIACGIVRLFPEGGLQRDCLRLARTLAGRGHRVTIFAAHRHGALPPGPEPVILPVRRWTNHGLDLAFAQRFAAAVQGKFDRVVGFNKLIGLDVLYCADPPLAQGHPSMWRRILPRYRTRLRLEGESFRPEARTHILALTEQLAAGYRAQWGTPPERFTVLPPSLDPARICPERRSEPGRQALRSALGISPGERVWLWVGAQPQTKGLDRVVAALAAEPATLLLVAGVAGESGAGRRSRIQAARLGLSDRVRFLGPRDDIPDLMAAADLLIHPARRETTGQAVLEAIVNGLPVVVSGICGFAELVRAAEAGIVLPEPFSQEALNDAVARLRDRVAAERFSQNGVHYGRRAPPVGGLDLAADIIEQGHGRARPIR